MAFESGDEEFPSSLLDFSDFFSILIPAFRNLKLYWVNFMRFSSEH